MSSAVLVMLLNLEVGILNLVWRHTKYCLAIRNLVWKRMQSCLCYFSKDFSFVPSQRLFDVFGEFDIADVLSSVIYL